MTRIFEKNGRYMNKKYPGKVMRMGPAPKIGRRMRGTGRSGELVICKYTPHARIAATRPEIRAVQIQGDFDDCMKQVQAVCVELGLYLLNSLNPFRLEGQKTIMFRIIEALGWQVPDWIVVPGGNLGNSSAFGKAFAELKQLGLIDRVPRMAIINATGADTRAHGGSRDEVANEDVARTVGVSGHEVRRSRVKHDVTLVGRERWPTTVAARSLCSAGRDVHARGSASDHVADEEVLLAVRVARHEVRC